jgi:hypothetical protein
MFTVRLSQQRPAPAQRVSRLARSVVQALCVVIVLALMLLVDTLFLHHTVWHLIADREPAAVHALKDRAEHMLHR